MDATTSATIDKINAQISALEGQIVSAKKTINTLCVMEGDAPLYPDIDRETSSAAVAFRSDQFYGKPAATAVKEILERRSTRNLGAISLDALYETLEAGGFEFENSNEPIAKRNLAILLSKNPSFTRVPNSGDWGLAKWYPDRKEKKGKATNNGTESGDEASSAKSTKAKEAR